MNDLSACVPSSPGPEQRSPTSPGEWIPENAVPLEEVKPLPAPPPSKPQEPPDQLPEPMPAPPSHHLENPMHALEAPAPAQKPIAEALCPSQPAEAAPSSQHVGEPMPALKTQASTQEQIAEALCLSQPAAAEAAAEAASSSQPAAAKVHQKPRGPNIHQPPHILQKICPPGCSMGLNRYLVDFGSCLFLVIEAHMEAKSSGPPYLLFLFQIIYH